MGMREKEGIPMNDKFNHPVLNDLYQTLDDINRLEAMLAEAKKQLHQDVTDLPSKIGDNEDLNDEVFHRLYWFDERVPATTLKKTFQRYPISQTGKADSHTAIRSAQVEIICRYCKMPFTGELKSRNQLAMYKSYGYVWDYTECKECQEKEKLHTEEQRRQWEAQRQQHIDRLHTMPYRDYLQTPEWKERRKRIMRKAGFRCQVCNAYGVQLNVHHRTYERRGCEWDADLIVLCRTCHEIFHMNGKLAKDEVE